MADVPTEIKYDLLDTRAAPPLSAGPGEPAVIAEEEAPATETETETETLTEAATEDATQAEAEAATIEGETETSTVEGEAKPPGRAKQRAQTLTEARREAEAREAAAVARETAAVEREARMAKMLEEALARAAPPPPPVEPPAPPEERPVRDAFDTPEAYDEALVGWAKRDEARTLRAQQTTESDEARIAKETADRTAAEAATAAGFETMRTTHLSRRDAFIAETPDYAEIAESDTLLISMPMGIAIMQSDDGPKAAYYLGQHPEIAAKIAAMVIPGQVFPPGNPMAGQPVPDVQRQLIEMGKVFAAVAAPEIPARPAPRPLPTPITPIRGGNGSAVARTLAEIGEEGSMEEYAAQRLPVLRETRRPFAKPH